MEPLEEDRHEDLERHEGNRQQHGDPETDAGRRVDFDVAELKADGSTACGCWIYCGCYKDGVNQPARRRSRLDQGYVAPEWGWAWPAW